MARPGIITGLADEARCLGGFDAASAPLVACGGADARRARRLARELVGQGCDGLISFGIAGGLDAGLGAGAVVIADRVVTPAGAAMPTSAPWRESLVGMLAAAVELHVRAVVGSDVLVSSVAAKRARAAETGAASVDMESHVVAEIAAEAALPFIVIRAVADPAHRSIPAWAAGTVGPDGATVYGAVIGRLLLRPWEVPAMVGLGRDSAKALAALRRVAGLAGPGFGLA